jgi:hypothetical protein
MSGTELEYVQDGEEAREIAAVIPYFPFKGIPRFYDIGGFLSQPESKWCTNKNDKRNSRCYCLLKIETFLSLS